MSTVVFVDAVPGYEDVVEAALEDLEPIRALVREKSGNHDLAILLEMEDAGEVKRFLMNDVRTLSGLKGYRQVDEPDADLLQRLEA